VPNSPWNHDDINRLEQIGALSTPTANAARMKLDNELGVTPQDSDKLVQYLQTNPIDEAAKGTPEAQAFSEQLVGHGKFRDTGRNASNMGEGVDSWLGVPARTALNEVAQGNYADAIPKAVKSFATDPQNAPTGHDVARNFGVSDDPMGKFTGEDVVDTASKFGGIPGAVAGFARKMIPQAWREKSFEPSPADVVGTAIDFGAQVPVGELAAAGKFVPGVSGSLAKVAKSSTLENEGYRFAKKALEGGETEVTAMFKGKPVGKAVLGADGAPSFDIHKLHDGEDVRDAMVQFGSMENLNGKAGAAEADMKDLSQAHAILKQIDTPEKAVALKGAEREQYLNALDQVYGDRESRASGMGFGDKTYYHGTTYNKGPIDSLRESQAGGMTGKYGKGVYLTDSSGYADQYAGHGEGSIYPVKLTKKEGFHPADVDHAEKLLQANKSVPEVNYPRRLRSTEEGLHLLEHNVGKRELSNVLNEQGVRIDTSAGESGDVATVVAKPNEIRSTSAAFDPRFKDSPLLLAGHAGPKELMRLPSSKKEEDKLIDHTVENDDWHAMETYMNHLHLVPDFKEEE
jgi:hypothetical protein